MGSRMVRTIWHKKNILAGFCSSAVKPKHSEVEIKDILKNKFPRAKSVDVVDISGGCGAMFEIVIESPDFKGLSIVKQHRMVNEALKEEIKGMHGIRIHTSH